MAGRQKLSTGRKWGEELLKTYDLQPYETTPSNSVLPVLNPNFIQADAQPRQVTVSGMLQGAIDEQIISPVAGSNTEIQYNASGVLGASADLTWDDTGKELSVGGDLTAGGNLTAASFIPTSSTVPTNGVYLPAANSVAISTNGTGRLFIDASGKVGIGTTSPGALLDVLASSGDNLCRIGGVGSTKSGFQFRANNVSYAEIYFQNSNPYPLVLGTKAGAGPVVFNVADNEKARIDTSGALLIGTNTSSNNARLGVAGSTHIGSGLNTVTLANGATGTVVTPARGYSYVNISINTTTSRGLLLLLFADSTSLSIVSTIDDNTSANYSASVSGRNLQVTNSSGSSVTFYASCLTLTWAEAG